MMYDVDGLFIHLDIDDEEGLTMKSNYIPLILPYQRPLTEDYPKMEKRFLFERKGQNARVVVVVAVPKVVLVLVRRVEVLHVVVRLVLQMVIVLLLLLL